MDFILSVTVIDLRNKQIKTLQKVRIINIAATVKIINISKVISEDKSHIFCIITMKAAFIILFNLLAFIVSIKCITLYSFNFKGILGL